MPEFHEKECHGCGLWLAPEFWGKNSSRPDGLQTRCKYCMAAYRLAWREKNVQYQRKRRKDLKGQYQVAQKRYSLKKRYAITPREYELMLLAQRSRCAICGDEPSGKIKTLCIDHDHETGQVRRLLCSPCNKGLGHFRERPDLMRKAADYIESFQPSPEAPVAVLAGAE